MNKSFISLGAFFLLQNSGLLKDPATVKLFQGVFIVLAAAQWFAWQRVTSEVEARKDEAASQRPIWVKKAAGANILNTLLGTPEGDGATPEYVATTYYELEAKKAKEQSAAATTAPLIQIAMGFYAGIVLPMAIQCIMMPLNLIEEPVLVKYIFGPLLGWPVPERPYGELLEDPAAPAPRARAAVGDAAAPGEAGDAGAAAGPASADVECEEAVLGLWEAKEPLDVAVFEHLRAQGKDVNYATAEGRWTALHVTAGSAVHGPRDVTRLLELGADPSRTDADGWTPLHWAAHHGVPAAIRTMCDAYGPPPAAGGSAAAGKKRVRLGDSDDLAALLRVADAKGRTALAVAREAGNAAAVDALLAAMARAGVVAPAAAAGSGKDAAPGADGLRQRAAAGAAQ